MHAAVVTGFTSPRSRSRTGPCPSPAPARSWSGSRRAGSATPTSTPPTATGRSSRPRRSSPATRASASSRRSAPGVTDRSVGERVALPWLGHACGHCDYCVSGWETLCETQQNTGYSIDGGLRRVRRRRRRLRRPGPRRASPARRRAADLRRRHDVQGDQGRRRPAHRAGRGRSASAAWATSPCSTPRSSAAPSSPSTSSEAKLDLAARARRRPRRQRRARPTRSPRSSELGGADVAVVLAVTPAVFEQAHASLRRGGRLVLRGLCRPRPTGPMALPIFDTVLKGISVIGSIVGTRQDLAEVFELHAARPHPGHRRDPQARRGQRVHRRRARRRGPPPGSCSSSERREQRSGAGVGLGRGQRPEDAGIDRVASPMSTNCSRQPLFTWVIRHWRPR